eukprot:GFUD01036095.1.p1 GENE.GFUD01036095.1~~GFUD01036095.1.p1  ORF type:complete len:417 (+),score=85.84 GFUD01036095.1:183-1433(+)
MILSFPIDVTQEIPEDAILNVHAERVGFYGNLPLPCVPSIQDIIDGLGNITKTTTTTTTKTETTTTSAADMEKADTTTTLLPPIPAVDLDCHFDISEVFDWKDGALCSEFNDDCSEIRKVGTHEGSVKMPVPLWLGGANINGDLDPLIAGTYVMEISVFGSSNETLGCSSVQFEISNPKAAATTTQEPDSENNVAMESCSESSKSSFEVSSLLVSPYPIVLHSFRSYDVLFAINVTKAIPNDATINVAVEIVTGDKTVTLPCLTADDIPDLLPPYNETDGDLTLNKSCEFSLSQLQEWNNGALCDLFEKGCPELLEVGTHSAKVNMKVPLFLGSAIFAGNLDGFIAGSYKLEISLLDTEYEVIGCASVTFNIDAPTTTTTTASTTTGDGGEDNNGGYKPMNSILFYFVCLCSILLY